MRRAFLTIIISIAAAFSALAQSPKYVALSFDDGPNLSITPRMLDVLEHNGVRASFFVIGRNVNEETAPVLKRMLALGFDVENHTFSHPDLTKVDDATVLQEIASTDSVIFKWCGATPSMLRPPFTDFNSRIARLVGGKVFIAGLSCQDWRSDLSVEDRVTRTLNRVKDGDILLFHDTNENTLEAIGIIIPELKKRGYVFLTVPELFAVCSSLPESHTDRMYSNVK